MTSAYRTDNAGRGASNLTWREFDGLFDSGLSRGCCDILGVAGAMYDLVCGTQVALRLEPERGVSKYC